MLHSVKTLKSYSIGAMDGHIGRVRDAYFDDQRWGIRYVVVDTGHWLPGRCVLISPRSLTRIAPEDKVLSAALTKAEVASSPDVDTEKPVSRQHELALSQYYGLPDSLMSETDAMPVPPAAMAGVPSVSAPAAEGDPPEEQGDSHLRSAQPSPCIIETDESDTSRRAPTSPCAPSTSSGHAPPRGSAMDRQWGVALSLGPGQCAARPAEPGALHPVAAVRSLARPCPARRCGSTSRDAHGDVAHPNSL